MVKAITVNGSARTADVDEDTPLLWVLRDVLGMTGTKFGCGRALSGNICRCGTYTRIREGIKRAAHVVASDKQRA